jgi:hypothetical protein
MLDCRALYSAHSSLMSFEKLNQCVSFLVLLPLKIESVELVQTDLVAGLLPRLAGAVDLLVGDSSCWQHCCRHSASSATAVDSSCWQLQQLLWAWCISSDSCQMRCLQPAAGVMWRLAIHGL